MLGLLDMERLRLTEGETLFEGDKLFDAEIDKLGLALTLVVPFLNTNVPTSVSCPEIRPEISGDPVELIANMFLLNTVRTPFPPT